MKRSILDMWMVDEYVGESRKAAGYVIILLVMGFMVYQSGSALIDGEFSFWMIPLGLIFAALIVRKILKREPAE